MERCSAARSAPHSAAWPARCSPPATSGCPLGPAGKAALVPHNIKAFAEGLDVTEDDVLLYLSLREAAHQRLFAHVPWLRQHLISSVEDFGRGVTIDVSGIEQAMGQIDPTNLEAMQEAMQGGLFEPQQTPEQKAALERLETTLALVEGWVDEVVGQATVERMPAASKMQEAIRRRRAAGGPAEETFAALVGLELRPRRLRDASTLWGSLRSRQGKEARDAVWAHPDLLPTAGAARRPARASARTCPRSPSSPTRTSTRPSASCWTASPARMRTTTGPEPDAASLTTPVTLHGDAVDVLTRWQAPTERPGAPARRSTSPTSPSTPTALWRSCFPAHLTAGALVLSHDRRHVLLNLHRKARRWFHFGGHLEPDDLTLAGRGAARGHRGVRPRRPAGGRRPAAPVHARRGVLRSRARPTTSTSGSWPVLGADTEPQASEESLDVRWWPVDELPTDEPDMVEMIELGLQR